MSCLLPAFINYFNQQYLFVLFIPKYFRWQKPYLFQIGAGKFPSKSKKLKISTSPFWFIGTPLKQCVQNHILHVVPTVGRIKFCRFSNPDLVPSPAAIFQNLLSTNEHMCVEVKFCVTFTLIFL